MWLYGEYILEQIGEYKLNHNKNFIQWFKHILAYLYTDFVHEFTLKKNPFHWSLQANKIPLHLTTC